MEPRFVTVQIGEATLPVEGAPRWEVRLVRGATGEGALVWAGAAEAPHVTVEAARAHAEAFFEDVMWRDDLAPRPDEVPCALCAAPVAASGAARVCPVCALEAVDASGRAVRFYAGEGGRLEAAREDGTRSEDARCSIRGVACEGRVSRFGWTFIQRVG